MYVRTYVGVLLVMTKLHCIILKLNVCAVNLFNIDSKFHVKNTPCYQHVQKFLCVSSEWWDLTEVL